MAQQQSPVFLERGSYRRRRMMDALRLLVLFAIILWMIPLAWPVGAESTGEPVAMSRALFYIFGVWGSLIAVSFLLARRLRDTTASVNSPDESDP